MPKHYRPSMGTAARETRGSRQAAIFLLRSCPHEWQINLRLGLLNGLPDPLLFSLVSILLDFLIRRARCDVFRTLHGCAFDTSHTSTACLMRCPIKRTKDMNPFRISLCALPAAAMALALAAVSLPGVASADSHADIAGHGTMYVVKSPTCGCCSAWAVLAREEGYAVEMTDTADMVSIKTDAGLPGDLWACHTARIGGYVIEGHVPFAAVAKLLTERPDIAGIAVPGMPSGSPGMGGDPNARYDVIGFGGSAAEGRVFYQAGL